MINNKDNKIKIPWYRRRIRRMQHDGFPVPEISFSDPKLRRPTPVRNIQPIRQPATQPAMEPAKQPVRAPYMAPDFEPAPEAYPFPLPGRQPQPRAIPEAGLKPPFRQPEPLPPLTPAQSIFAQDIDWSLYAKAVDWEKLDEIQRKNFPEPQQKNLLAEGFVNVIKPVALFFIAREAVNQYVEVNITDPIYERMLQDPVLGAVLREAENADADMRALATYLANYDYDNYDHEEMLLGLTAIVGAREAARIIIYFVGRRVLFRL